LIARIHACAALATLVNLLVYAAAGLASRSTPAAAAFDRPFSVRAGETDRAIAERVVRLLGLSLATPVHDFNISHDSAGRLALDFYHANGRHKVTVFPDRLHVEATRAHFARYLSTLHVTTAAFHSGDWRMQVWAWYNEFALWALAAMLGSGAWMLLTRRGPRGWLRRTHWIVGLVALPVLSVFVVSAVQLAHRTWLSTGPVLRSLHSLHRGRGFALAPVAAVILLVLAATGVCLWFQTRRSHPVATALLALGTAVSGGLILWMRAG